VQRKELVEVESGQGQRRIKEITHFYVKRRSIWGKGLLRTPARARGGQGDAVVSKFEQRRYWGGHKKGKGKRDRAPEGRGKVKTMGVPRCTHRDLK